MIDNELSATLKTLAAAFGLTFVACLPAAAQNVPERVPTRAIMNANHCDGELEIEACIGLLEYRLGDYREAVKIWRGLAREGDTLAQRNLALMFQRGRGVPKDPVKAVRWFKRAADKGDTGSQLALGAMYQQGEGVRQDESRAARLYRRAARGGSARAAHRLALMYRHGIGVGSDSRAELRYMKIAAFRGLSEAQVEIGKFFFRRKRDDGDKVRACAFFRFAIDTAQETIIRREASDWLFRVQDDIDSEGAHRCRETARQWRRSLSANGGRAPY